VTNRLYYLDPYLREFDATIERVERGGAGMIVTLDRTAFYPTSGGQPFDTGVLGGFRVIDVSEMDDGSVAHVVDVSARPELVDGRARDTSAGTSTPTPTPGSQVRGIIDWPRRFDHMQQHTGQHVLSAAFDKRFGVRTVSFHLGSDASTIDLARDVPAADIATAEKEANRIVWEDRPVSIRFAAADEAARLPLRKESARTGTLRLIDVDGFDLSACGGTHVSRTGAIGVIAVAGWERFKGGLRVEFVCGGRALSRFRALRDTVAASVRLLSVLPAELPAAVERMQAAAKDQKRTIGALQDELSAFRADTLAAAAECSAAGHAVLRAVDADANGLKSLAMAIAARPGHVAVLTSVSRPALVVVARASDATHVSSQQIVAALVEQFGGRGGGKPEVAQAGGLNASAEEVLNAARDALAASSRN